MSDTSAIMIVIAIVSVMCTIYICETIRTVVKGLDRNNTTGNIDSGTRFRQISPARIYECEKCGQNVMTDDIDAYKYCHGCGRKVKHDRPEQNAGHSPLDQG